MLAVSLVAAIGLLGVGMIFSSSFSASQVAGQARSLHWTNAALGSVGIARAAVAQAVFFSFDTAPEVHPDSRSAALSEAEMNLAAVESLLNRTEAPSGSMAGSIEVFLREGQAVLALAAAGQAPEAEQLRVSSFEPEFAALETQLVDRQTQLADEIAASEVETGRISRWTQLAMSLVLPALVMVIFWLTLRRRVRREKSVMQARVEYERQMNKAKDEFIAGLSHELRTPLTSIFGFSEVLLDENRLDQSSAELVGLINAGAADLSRMVDDLLAAARLSAEALTTRPIRVDLAEQANAVAAPYVRTGENVKIDVPKMEVYVDPVHLRQIIHNLVSNALRHGGEHVVISGSRHNGKVHLIVADDGPGVSKEAEERLFQRFSNRGKEALIAGSVGLGLAISQELAMRMGGVIRYGRTDGWTTFVLRLPALPQVEDDMRTLVEAASADHEAV